MKILIIKHGALGDVVRTSYFARSFKLKYKDNLELFWYTSMHSRELLEHNPYIDHIITDISDISPIEFDHIYSLDDETSILDNLLSLKSKRFTGAYILDGKRKYTEDSALWFDMGLISAFGKAYADILKRKNCLGHAKIFKQIFEVQDVSPYFFKNPKVIDDKILDELKPFTLIGINPYAGQRWPSKELPENEIYQLINTLLSKYKNNEKIKLLLFGSGHNRVQNSKIANSFNQKDKIIVPDTDQSIMALANYISLLHLLISSDSLPMHLAIAQRINTLAFFTATSAEEIDDFGKLIKLKSTSNDYCSYLPFCDNSSITSERIMSMINPYL